MFELSPNIDKNKIFLVNLSEIEGRLDPYYYSHPFINIKKLLIKNNYIKFRKIIKSLTNGYDYRNYSKSGTPYIKVANIKKGFFDFSKLQFVNFNSSEISKKIQLKKGNILLTRKGSFGIALALDKDYNYVISSEIFYIEIDNNIVNPKFLEIFFNSNIGQQQFDQNKIGAIMGSLSQEVINNLIIPLPPKETQQKIIDLFENAYKEKQQKDAEAERLLNSIDDYLLGELGITLPEKDNSLENRMFKVNFSEVTGNRWNSEYHQTYFKDCYNSMSKKYELIELSDLSLEIFQGVGRDLTDDNKFHLLKVKNIKKHNQIDYTDIENVKSVPTFKLLRKYDVISPFIGEAIRQIKFSNFYKEEGNWTVDNNTGVIRLKLDIVNPEFICQILNSRIGKIQIHQLIGGGGVPFLGAFNVRKFKIPLPPLEKQNEIAEHIKQIRDQAKQLKAEAKEVLEQAKQEVEKMILGK